MKFSKDVRPMYVWGEDYGEPEAVWITILYNEMCDDVFEHYIGFPERVKDYA